MKHILEIEESWHPRKKEFFEDLRNKYMTSLYFRAISWMGSLNDWNFLTSKETPKDEASILAGCYEAMWYVLDPPESPIDWDLVYRNKYGFWRHDKTPQEGIYLPETQYSSPPHPQSIKEMYPRQRQGYECDERWEQEQAIKFSRSNIIQRGKFSIWSGREWPRHCGEEMRLQAAATTGAIEVELCCNVCNSSNLPSNGKVKQ